MKTITINKKQDKSNFDAIMYCVKARGKDWPSLEYLCIKQGRIMATDSHRAHITRINNILDGMYEYGKVRFVITLKPVESQFPDINAIISKSFDHICKVDTAKLLQLCKMAAILSNSHYQQTNLTFNGHLDLHMVNPDVGYMDGQVDIDNPINPELKLGINVRYLIEALQGLDKQVTIKLQHNDTAPMIFRDNSKVALIMPMKV